MRRLCVMGLGNVLVGDDALGPYVLHVLQTEYDFPPEVTLFDAGTPGLDLTLFIEGLDGLVVVDSVKAKGAPGDVRVYDKQQLLHAPLPTVTSPHEPSLREALMRLELLGHGPRECVAVGAIPENLTTGTGLSAPVARALPEVVRQALRALEGMGAKAAPRACAEADRTPWWERGGLSTSTRGGRPPQGVHPASGGGV